jgi:L-aspartate oxidase
MSHQTDVLVIGSGVAGLMLALRAAAYGDVLILTKKDAEDSNTNWAQGGIAAVFDRGDTFADHERDTLRCGAGLSDRAVVRQVVREAPGRVRGLEALGVAFSRGSRGLALGREGGHSRRRIVHASDLTGRAIETALIERVRAHPRVRMIEDQLAVDLIIESRMRRRSAGRADTCWGAYVMDARTHHIRPMIAKVTVLATGGCGKVYLYTSNPDIATGDGVAMAYRAGAEIGNMEFYQFHPTCLYHPKAKSFLITEALRGEGAILRLPNDQRTAFMQRHDEREDLAPRDIVARAIDFEMKRAGYDHVLLDITHKPADFVKAHFPTIYQRCLGWGIDITREPIPVVPAAHYMCGGVTTDMKGRTTIPGLSCVGEASFTGLHGANRLASNSLLEGMVFGHRAASRVVEALAESRSQPWPQVPEWQTGNAVPSDEAVVVAHNWDELRRTMWNYVGIVRSDSRLRRAARRIALLQEEIREYYWKHMVTRDLLELRNIATVAELIVACAAARKESRGLHHTIDHPETDDALIADTIVKRGVPAHMRASLNGG